MGRRILWTESDMILATLEHWGREDFAVTDCRVVDSVDARDKSCLIVWHRPSGRTSDEAGNAGRWHRDGSAY